MAVDRTMCFAQYDWKWLFCCVLIFVHRWISMNFSNTCWPFKPINVCVYERTINAIIEIRPFVFWNRKIGIPAASNIAFRICARSHRPRPTTKNTSDRLNLSISIIHHNGCRLNVRKWWTFLKSSVSLAQSIHPGTSVEQFQSSPKEKICEES